jgi:4-amino-4-deoxy-L-arabinose transferase-like glycosyltransferase
MSRRKRARDRTESLRNGREPQASLPSALTRGQRLIATASLLAWCACSLLLVGLIPRGDAPDEVAHLAYIDHLSHTWAPIDFRTEPRGTEAHQPPLYYALCAALWRATGESLVALRLVSTICGLGLAIATFALARAWRPAAGFGFHWTCAAVLAFLPMNLYICSAVNNDPLVNLLVAAGLLHLWRSRGSQRPVLDAGIAGAIAGLAMLTKSTALALVATCIVWFGLSCVSADDPGRAVRRAAGFLIGLGITWGPWAVYNTWRYGDPLAASAFAQVAAGVPPAQLGATGLWYWVRWVMPFTWFTLWGAYDHLVHADDFMPMVWYAAFIPLLLIAAWTMARRTRRWWAEPEYRTLAASLAAGMAVLLVGFVSFNRVVFQAQARYFFCYLPVFCVLLCYGLHALGGWKARIALMCLAALLAAGCLDGLVWRMWS